MSKLKPKLGPTGHRNRCDDLRQSAAETVTMSKRHPYANAARTGICCDQKRFSFIITTYRINMHQQLLACIAMYCNAQFAEKSVLNLSLRTTKGPMCSQNSFVPNIESTQKTGNSQEFTWSQQETYYIASKTTASSKKRTSKKRCRKKSNKHINWYICYLCLS